jgi:hypothetical protein
LQGAKRLAIATAIAAGLILAARGAGPAASAQEAATGNVRVATSGSHSERRGSIPITKREHAGDRVVMSLGPRRLRRLRSGDLLAGRAEVGVSTTCVRPEWWRCVGRPYRFSPVVGARLVLAGGPRAARASRVLPVSGWTWVRCSQNRRHRNHHCVLTIPEAERVLPEVDELPCDAERCHLNLVLTAHHPRAKRGNRLVVGVDGRRRIVQNKGQLAAAVYRPPQVAEQGEQLLTTERVRRRVPMGPRRPGGARRRVIYSQRLDDLRAGEQLVVEARAPARIEHLSYNALVQAKLILSERRAVPKRAARARAVGTFDGRFGTQNGFNCTQGPSGHSTPCVIRKTGVMRIVNDARERPRTGEGDPIPLYVSLVAGTRAVGLRGHRRRQGHVLRVGDEGFLRVHRYGREFRRGASPPPPTVSPDEDSLLPLP